VSIMDESYVVGSRYSYAVLERMPAHVQYLLVKVNLVCIRLFSHPLASTNGTRSWAASSGSSLLATRSSWTRRRVHRSRYAHFLRLECRLVRLQHDLGILLGVGWVDHEVVIVRSSHDVLRVTRKDDLKFIEDAVVLVSVAKSWSEVFVDRYGLDRLSLHVYVPDLDGEVVARKYVPTIV
jgi:hypothetical protein